MEGGIDLQCVLFDLDGTLVDTAPDLIASLNKALLDYGYASVDANWIKPFISYGAATMIDRSVEDVDDATKAKVLEVMLTHYQHNIAEHSCFFNGIEWLLTEIEQLGLKWGIVTNKRECFTTPLLDAFGLTSRVACAVSGDTTPYSKPHPEPMLTACRLAAVEPVHCLYVGDAEHDIAAGKNANMKTLAALYGYLKPDDKPHEWGADGFLDTPEQLIAWIRSTQCA